MGEKPKIFRRRISDTWYQIISDNTIDWYKTAFNWFINATFAWVIGHFVVAWFTFVVGDIYPDGARIGGSLGFAFVLLYLLNKVNFIHRSYYKERYVIDKE